MTISDPVGDMLTRLRNGQQAKLFSVRVPASRFLESILKVMRQEGYVGEIRRIHLRPGVDQLEVDLRYHQGQPVIQIIKRMSKPGRRIFVRHDQLPNVFNGLGTAIISTSRGVVTDHVARQNNVGGEVLCTLF